MFLLTFLVVNMADTKRKLENDVFAAAGIAQKYNCALTRLDYQQEAGLMSSVPLGENLVPIQRGLTTSSIPTKDGINLVCVLPEALTSPKLTAEWENNLTQIAKGKADPDAFMGGIEEMAKGLVKSYPFLSDEKKDLFKPERAELGKCPRCGSPVYEGKKNYYCSNKECNFTMWKNDRFFEERKVNFSPKIAAALLKDGKATVKKLYSPKTGKTYEGTVLLADTGGKYVNYRVELPKKRK